MKIFCTYGIGLMTERGYHYLKVDPDQGVKDKQTGNAVWRLNNAAQDEDAGLVGTSSSAMNAMGSGPKLKCQRDSEKVLRVEIVIITQ